MTKINLVTGKPKTVITGHRLVRRKVLAFLTFGGVRINLGKLPLQPDKQTYRNMVCKST